MFMEERQQDIVKRINESGGFWYRKFSRFTMCPQTAPDGICGCWKAGVCFREPMAGL